MKRVLFILIFLTCISDVFSQEVSIKKAKQSAPAQAPSVMEESLKDGDRLQDEKDDYEEREVELRVKDPNSFDYQYLKYVNSPADDKDFTALKNAYKVASTNKEVQFEMAKYYELVNDKVSKQELCKKLNTSLSSGLKEYAYNTLMSVEKNGILITFGEDDTYPIWVLQELENVRKDVKVLNYDLLVNKEYRKQQEGKLGLKFANKYSNNLDVLKDVSIKNPNKNIYYSLTVSHLILKQLKANLYNTGLALKYSETAYNNTKELKTNWETGFKKVALKSVTKNNVDTKIEMNYVLALVQLSKYYKVNNQTKKYDEVKQLALAIAKRNGKENQVIKLFN